MVSSMGALNTQGGLDLSLPFMVFMVEEDTDRGTMNGTRGSEARN